MNEPERLLAILRRMPADATPLMSFTGDSQLTPAPSTTIADGLYLPASTCAKIADILGEVERMANH